MKYLMTLLIMSLLATSVHAQLSSSDLSSIPEIASDKDYKKADILEIGENRPTLKLETTSFASPEHVFGKISKKKYITVLSYTHNEGAIHLHAYSYSTKDQSLLKVNRFIFSTGDFSASDRYDGMIKLVDGEYLKIKQIHNHKTAFKTYEFGKKYMDFGEHLDSDTAW